MIEVRTLTDGGQSSLDIAHAVAAWLDAATHSLALALYDVRLHADTAELVKAALVGAHDRGVDVRLLYNVERDRHSGDRAADVVDASAGDVEPHVHPERLPVVAEVEAVRERHDLVAPRMVEKNRRLGRAPLHQHVAR